VAFAEPSQRLGHGAELLVELAGPPVDAGRLAGAMQDVLVELFDEFAVGRLRAIPVGEFGRIDEALGDGLVEIVLWKW